MVQKEFERSAGILMPVSSLPSPYGIGTFGKSAYEFVDRLVEARQKYWQVLPLGPTSYGDSPYASFSAFAGNPYFIDLDVLIEEGLLDKGYVESFKWNMEDQYVDYGLIYNSRFTVLQKAYENSNHKDTEEYKEFLKENTVSIVHVKRNLILHHGRIGMMILNISCRGQQKSIWKNYQRILTFSDLFSLNFMNSGIN